MWVSGDPAGTLEVRGTWPRFNITDPTKVKTWRNVEITYYFKVVQQVQGTADYGVAAESRDGDLGPFPDSTGLGYSYNHAMRYRGRVFFQKEVTDHCAYTGGVQTTTPWTTPDRSMPVGQWIGVKYVVRNSEANTHATMALHVDLSDGQNGGAWTKIAEYKDVGGWTAQLVMNCSPTNNLAPSRPLDWVITNATNNIRFRADYANPVMFKKVSIREIAPLP
jgi:hypothetical protein